MKKLLRVAIFVGVCGLGWPKAYANDCYSDGYQLVWGCKQAMAERTRHNYPLCTWLVRNGWRNAQRESATTAWATWQRGACSFVLP